jgi:tetraacyldisaccharide 4'-kinase
MALKALEPLEQFATDVILDRAAGRRASLLKPFLLLLATVYAGIMRIRARFYQDAIFRRYSVGVMVISVGNLTVGGTGKTPVVEKLARSLQEAGRRVAILSRGYKSVPKPFLTRLADKFLPGRTPSPPRVVSDGKSVLLDSAQSGDEPFMLARNLPGVAVLVDSDRVKSARHAIRHYQADTLRSEERV